MTRFTGGREPTEEATDELGGPDPAEERDELQLAGSGIRGPGQRLPRRLMPARYPLETISREEPDQRHRCPLVAAGHDSSGREP